MSDESDFTVEPVNGLPEALPDGEEILWQGKPDVLALAREAMGLYWIIGYFVVVAFWRFMASTASMDTAAALGTAVPFVILGAVAAGIILLIAYVQARATVYTITSERVAMRIGAALTLTLNLPFPKIGSADLDLRARGTGTIALSTLSHVRLSYMILWPHVRPRHVRNTQPALRCIKDAERVAAILAEAAETRIAQPSLARRSPAMAPAE